MLRCDVTDTVILCLCNGNKGTDTLLFAPAKVMELPLLGAVTMLTFGKQVSAVLNFLKQKDAFEAKLLPAARYSLLDPSELFVIEGRAPIIWDFNALGDGIRMTMGVVGGGGGGRDRRSMK